MRRTARLVGLALGCLLAAPGCRGGTTRAETPVAPSGRPTLFARIGGMDGIRALVDEIASRVAADARIQRFFADTDFRRFKGQLVVQLCEMTGGPCRYRGRAMDAAHRGRGVRREHFDAFIEAVAGAFEGTRVGERDRGELIELVGRQRAAVIDGARR